MGKGFYAQKLGKCGKKDFALPKTKKRIKILKIISKTFNEKTIIRWLVNGSVQLRFHRWLYEPNETLTVGGSVYFDVM